MPNREWRLRIHEAGTTTPGDGTVDYSFGSEVKEAPSVGGQTVRILDGRSESQPWQVDIVDASSAVTSILGDADARAQLAYRIADIGKRDDGGSWDVLATGRLTGIDLRGLAAYTISVSDERAIERATTLWKGAGGTTTIFGFGFVSGSYGPFATGSVFAEFFGSTIPQTRAHFKKGEHDTNATVIEVVPRSSDTRTVPRSLVSAIEEDVKQDAPLVGGPNSTGNYRTMRLRLIGEVADRELIGVKPLPGAGDDGPASYPDPDGQLDIIRFLVYDPSNTFPAEADGYLYMPGADPTPDVPLHIEQRPAELLEQIYDGDYSDGVAIRYDAAALTALKNRLQADGVGSLRWRVTGTEKMSTWLEDNIYKPLGVVPLIGADGAIKPVKVYPTESEVSDVGTLYEFTESNSRLVSWRYAPEEAVSVVRATYPSESQFTIEAFAEGDKSALDTISETDQEHEETHDAATDRDSVLELSLRGWHDRDRVEQFMKLRSREIFEMFGDGPLHATLWSSDASDTVVAGDYAVVDHSALPSPTNQRGDSRIVFVMSRTALPNGYQFDVIEVGPSLQPLAAPSISVVQAGDGATVTFSSVPSGAFWELRTHDGDSVGAPSDTDTGWRTIATGTAATHTLPVIKHGVKVWFQARARKEGRIPSDWSTAQSLTISAITAPSSLAIDEQGGAFLRASFTAGDDELPTEVHLEGVLVLWLPAGSTSFEFRGLTPSTTYNSPGLQVRHVDPRTGATSAFATVTFTTAATAETAPTYVAAALLIGESG